MPAEPNNDNSSSPGPTQSAPLALQILCRRLSCKDVQSSSVVSVILVSPLVLHLDGGIPQGPAPLRPQLVLSLRSRMLKLRKLSKQLPRKSIWPVYRLKSFFRSLSKRSEALGNWLPPGGRFLHRDLQLTPHSVRVGTLTPLVSRC